MWFNKGQSVFSFVRLHFLSLKGANAQSSIVEVVDDQTVAMRVKKVISSPFLKFMTSQAKRFGPVG